MKKFKSDYAAHDLGYKKRLEQGQRGWDSEEGSRKSTQVIEKFLAPHGLIQNGNTLLELGCGGAQMAKFFAEKGLAVSGIDISPLAVKMANENFSASKLKGTFVLGSVLNVTDFFINSFDLILDGHCLHCIIGEDRKRFFSEAARLMKKSSALVIKTMCGEVLKAPKGHIFDRENRCLLNDNIATRYIGQSNSILDEVKNSGFVIKDQTIIERDSPENLDELLILATL